MPTIVPLAWQMMDGVPEVPAGATLAIRTICTGSLNCTGSNTISGGAGGGTLYYGTTGANGTGFCDPKSATTGVPEGAA